jgi:hypothetical protein
MTKKHLLPAIFGAAAMLRISGLLSGSIWYDEAFTIYMARLPLFELVRSNAIDFTPPLWDISVWIASRIFGLYAGRLLALAAGLVSLWLAWLLLDDFKLTDHAKIAAALGLCLPYFAWLSQDGRTYSLFAALYLAGALFALRGRLTGLAAICGLLMYSHTTGVLFAWSLLLIALMYAPLRRVVLAGALAGLAYVPWLPAIYWQSQHATMHWLGPVTPALLLREFQLLFFGGSINDVSIILFSALLIGLSILIAVIAASGSLARNNSSRAVSWSIIHLYHSIDPASRDRIAPYVAGLMYQAQRKTEGPYVPVDDKRPQAALLLLAVAPFVMMLILAHWQNVIYYRPLSPILAPLVLFLAAWLTPIKWPSARWLLAACWLVLLAGGLLGWSAEIKGGRLDQAAANLQAAIRPGDIVYHITPTTYLPFSLYSAPDEREYLYPLPPDTSYGLLSYPTQIKLDLPRADLSSLDYNRAWIVYARDPLLPPAVVDDLAPIIDQAQLVGFVHYWQAAQIEVYLYANKKTILGQTR